jgi:hypothetical protein
MDKRFTTFAVVVLVAIGLATALAFALANWLEAQPRPATTTVVTT